MIDQIILKKEKSKKWREILREINIEKIEKELWKKYLNLEMILYEIEINELNEEDMKDM